MQQKEKTDTYLSFYLKNNRIHICVHILRMIGCPDNICILADQKGDKIIIAPYGKRDLRSHRVPRSIYEGKRQMEISSIGLCTLIQKQHNWEANISYRVPGTVFSSQKLMVADLTKAEKIGVNHFFRGIDIATL